MSRERKVSKTSENKNQDNLKKPRKSHSPQALGKSEVVIRSPFLDDNRPPMTAVEPDADDTGEPLKLPSKPLQIFTDVAPTPRQLPPTPTTPPRLPHHAGVPCTANSPSPRSNLVSKRFHGPRSPAASPSSEPGSTKRQRRKTVTFDERCDVLEFDQDEPSEVLISDEEDGDPNDEAWDEYPQESPAMSDTVESVVESLLAEEVRGPGTVHTTFDYDPPEHHVIEGEHIQGGWIRLLTLDLLNKPPQNLAHPKSKKTMFPLKMNPGSLSEKLFSRLRPRNDSATGRLTEIRVLLAVLPLPRMKYGAKWKGRTKMGRRLFLALSHFQLI